MANSLCSFASPKPGGKKGQWRAIAAQDDVSKVLQQVAQHRATFTPEWAQNMVERQLTPKELSWVVNEALRTPTQIALSLIADALRSDYTPEVVLLDQAGIPMLNVVSAAMSSEATPWLQSNALHS